MKKTILLCALILSAILFVSCSGDEAAAPSASITAKVSETQTEPHVFQDIDDVTSVSSGDFIAGKEIYRLNKAEKTLRILNFDLNYNKYITDSGTTVFETDVKFVRYNGIYDAVYYIRDDVVNLLYESGGTIYRARLTDSGLITTSLSAFPTKLIQPTYGNYVSGELNQYKTDAEGNRIQLSDGSFEKEKFFLFLDIDETNIKLYVGENNLEHAAEPILSTDNYTLSYNSSGIAINVSRGEGNYALRLTVSGSETIKFVNDFIVYGDYSGSGTFTLT